MQKQGRSAPLSAHAKSRSCACLLRLRCSCEATKLPERMAAIAQLVLRDGPPDFIALQAGRGRGALYMVLSVFYIGALQAGIRRAAAVQAESRRRCPAKLQACMCRRALQT